MLAPPPLMIFPPSRPCGRRDCSLTRPLGSGGAVYKSVFVPLHGVKSHLPKSNRSLPRSGSNERSRSPLSIGVLHVARGDRNRVRTKIGSKIVHRFPAQSRPLARLVQDNGSRKLPQITTSLLCDFHCPIDEENMSCHTNMPRPFACLG